MPKSTTGCQIISFITIENMNVEKLRATKSNPNMFIQVSIVPGMFKLEDFHRPEKPLEKKSIKGSRNKKKFQ